MKHRLILIGLGVVLTTLSGCSETPTPTPTAQATTVAASPTPETQTDLGAFADDEVKARAAKLVESHTERGFPSEVFKEKENGPAILYLAATSDNPTIRLNALKGLQSAYTTSSSSKTQTQVDKNYDDVVLFFLNNGDDSQLYYALKASEKSLRSDGSPEVLSRLIEIGSSDERPEARYGALSAFAYLGSRAEKPEVVDLYLKAYKDEPETAEIALKWTGTAFGRAPQAADVQVAVVELTKHGEPVVRGEAAYVLGKVFPKEEALVVETSKPMLKDTSPYVRAKALSGLSYLKLPAVLLMIEPLLDDPAKTDTKLSITNLLGKTGNKNFTTFGWGRVDGTALKALEDASARIDRENAFKLGKIEYKTKDNDIAREVKLAKKWLAENK